MLRARCIQVLVSRTRLQPVSVVLVFSTREEILFHDPVLLKFLHDVLLLVKLVHWQPSILLELADEVSFEFELVPLVVFLDPILLLLGREVHRVAVLFHFEEECLLGLHCLAWSLNKYLHDVITHIHNTDVFESRTDDEGKLLLIEARH